MSLPNSLKYSASNSRLVKLSLLTAFGIILFLFESLIPRPLPWLKPGLSHIATLIALYTMGFSDAMAVVILRILVGSLLIGSLFNPAFILSLGGGIAATLMMGFAQRHCSKFLSIFGVSILGAVVHNMTQLFLVEILIIGRIEIYYLAPVMILSALFTGFIVAFVSCFLIEKTRLS